MFPCTGLPSLLPQLRRQKEIYRQPCLFQTFEISKLQVVIEAGKKIIHIFSIEIIQIFCTIHLAFQAEGKVVGNRALKVRIPLKNDF